MKSKEEKIRKRDNHLLKNEKSWRRARIGAICLAIIFIIIPLILKKQLLQENSKEGLYSFIVWVVFWLFIVDWLNLRIGHIDSIKLYRKENGTIKE